MLRLAHRGIIHCIAVQIADMNEPDKGKILNLTS